MKVSPNLFILVLTIFFIPGVFASSISGDIYSVERDHLGIAGNTLQGESYSFRDSLTYQYPVNKYPVSGIYSLSFGWHKSELSSSAEGGDTITTTSGGSSGGGSGCSYNEFYDWECSEWDDCVNGKQTRTCKEKNNCGTTYKRPDVERSCEANKQLFDINWNLEDSKIENSSELVGIVMFERFGNVPTFVNLTFIVLGEKGEKLYLENGNITVITEEILKWDFENLSELPEGHYVAVLQTLYNANVFDEFRQEFIVGKRDNLWKYLVGLLLGIIILIASIILIRKYKAKKIKSRRIKNVGEYKKKIKERLDDKNKRKTRLFSLR